MKKSQETGRSGQDAFEESGCPRVDEFCRGQPFFCSLQLFLRQLVLFGGFTVVRFIGLIISRGYAIDKTYSSLTCSVAAWVIIGTVLKTSRRCGNERRCSGND